MRNFQTLDKITVQEDTGILLLTSSEQSNVNPVLMMRREGGYIAISASYGPLEIALRPRFEDLSNKLTRLQPVSGLQMTRQVGTAEAYLGLGLREDGMMVVRPTIVADATGHFSFNLVLTDAARKALFDWLPLEPKSAADE